MSRATLPQGRSRWLGSWTVTITSRATWTAAVIAMLLALVPSGAAVAVPSVASSGGETWSATAVAPAVRAALGAPVTGGKKGVAITRLPKQGKSTGEYVEPGAVAVDAKGRVVVAASDWNYLVVLRYRANGKLDKSFGTKGIVRLRLGKSDVAANDVTFDRKGRVVVAATSNAYAHNPKARVVRFTAKGKVDKKFAKKGVFTKKNAKAGGLAVDTKGRIVLAGRSTKPSGAWITRLTAKGKVQKSFGMKGTVRFNKYGAEENSRVGTGATDVLLDEQGRIVVHLGVFLGIARGNEYGLARLTPTGAFDTSFYGGGWHTSRYVSPEGSHVNVSAAGLARSRDGGFVAAGGADGGFALYAYGPDGTPEGQVAATKVSKKLDERAVAVAVDHQGRIISAGSATQRLGITRHTRTFGADTKFNARGIVHRKVPGFSEVRVSDVTTDAKGRVVVTAIGYPKKSSTKRAILVFRYTAKGKPHAAWGR